MKSARKRDGDARRYTERSRLAFTINGRATNTRARSMLIINTNTRWRLFIGQPVSTADAITTIITSAQLQVWSISSTDTVNAWMKSPSRARARPCPWTGMSTASALLCCRRATESSRYGIPPQGAPSASTPTSRILPSWHGPRLALSWWWAPPRATS